MQLQNETAGLQAEALREGFRRSNELGEALTGLPSAFGKFKRNNPGGFKFAIGEEPGNINSFLDSINHNALFNAHKAERRAGLIPRTGTNAVTEGARLASQNEARRAASLGGLSAQIGPILDALLNQQSNTGRYSQGFEDFATREFGG